MFGFIILNKGDFSHSCILLPKVCMKPSLSLYSHAGEDIS
jgi:hypothetical protein